MTDEIGWVDLGVRPDVDGFGPDLDRRLGPTMASVGRSNGERLGRAIGHAAVGATAVTIGAGYAAFRFVDSSFRGFEDHLRVTADTRNTIKSTGGAANTTALQVGRLSDALERKTGVDGDNIQSGANMLLTFKNVRDEAGAGNKIFDRSVSILTDMSTKMKTDASSSAIQLGKALNDPVKGITALTRVGVTFTDQQKDQIAAYEKQGDLASAQKIILGELQSEFGGAAKAQMTMGDQVMVSFHALQDSVGKAALPAVRQFQRFLVDDGIPTAQKFVGWLSDDEIPKFSAWLRDDAVPAAKDLYDRMRPLADQVLPAVATGARDVRDFLGDAAPFAERMVSAFNDMPDWLKKDLVGGALLTGAAYKTGLIGGGKGTVATAASSLVGRGSATNPMWVRVIGGVGGVGGIGGELGQVTKPGRGGLVGAYGRGSWLGPALGVPMLLNSTDHSDPNWMLNRIAGAGLVGSRFGPVGAAAG